MPQLAAGDNGNVRKFKTEKDTQPEHTVNQLDRPNTNCRWDYCASGANGGV